MDEMFRDELGKLYVTLDRTAKYTPGPTEGDVRKSAALAQERQRLRERIAQNPNDAEARTELAKVERDLGAILKEDMERQSRIRDVRKAAQDFRARQSRDVLAIRCRETMEAVDGCVKNADLRKNTDAMLLELGECLERTMKWVEARNAES